MEQGKQHGTQGGGPCPAVGHQQFPQGFQAAGILQRAGGQIGHEDDGNDDLVGGKAQQKGHQYGAIHPQQPSKGVQKAGTPVQNAGAPYGDIGAQPDHQPGRGSHCHRTPQYKQGPVQHRADQDLSHPGAAVGRQLQGIGRRHPLQQRIGQQPGDSEGHDYSQKDGPGEQQRGRHSLPQPPRRTHKKHGDQSNQGRKPPIAGDKAVGEYGNQPLPGGVDDAASHHTGGITSESHTYRLYNYVL